ATHLDAETTKEGLDYLKQISRIILGNVVPISLAHADDAGDQKSYATQALLYTLGGALVAGSAITALAGDTFMHAIMTPPGRLIWSGLLVGWSVTMIIWLQNQKAEAHDRRDKLRDIGNNFGQA